MSRPVLGTLFGSITSARLKEARQVLQLRLDIPSGAHGYLTKREHTHDTCKLVEHCSCCESLGVGDGNMFEELSFASI